jgi:hypothetical protein
MPDDKFEGIWFYSTVEPASKKDRQDLGAKMCASLYGFMHLVNDDQCDIETMDHFLMCTRILISTHCYFEMYHLFALYGVIKKTVTLGRDTFNYTSLHGPGAAVLFGGATSMMAEMQILDIFDWKLFMFPGPGALACVIFRRVARHHQIDVCTQKEWEMFKKIRHEACLSCLYDANFSKQLEEIAFDVAYRVFEKYYDTNSTWVETKKQIRDEFYSEWRQPA